MIKRLGSIRNIVILFTLVLAALGLIITFFFANVVENNSRNNFSDGIVHQVLDAANDSSNLPATTRQHVFEVLSSTSPFVGLVVTQRNSKGGESLIYRYTTPAIPGEAPLHQYERGHGYTSTVTYYPSSNTQTSFQVTAASGVLILLIIVSGFSMATVLARRLRRQVDEVVTAAEKIATGDYTARIDPSGPEEIAKLAVAFDHMAQHLEESDESKRRFLSDLAHEIATPLNSISGFAIALSDGTITDESDQEQISEIIHSETERIRGLLDDLRNLEVLDLSYPSSKVNVALKEYASNLILRFSPQAKARSVTVKSEVGRSVAEADRRLLDMVVQNFLSNAIRYVDVGGEVTIYAKELPHHEVAIGVKDNGIGIAPDELSRIFDRLYRVDAARNRVSGGSGLGLSIAQKAAHNLDGRIEVTSSVGKGSDFRLIVRRGTSPLRRTSRQPAASSAARSHHDAQ